MPKYIFILFFLFVSAGSKSQVPGDSLLKIVSLGEIKLLKKHIGTAWLDSLYGSPGKTLLQAAIESRNSKIARYLLRKGADTELALAGKTHLILAVSMQNEEMTKLLISKGARIDGRDENGNTPLHYAAFVGSLSIVQMLVEKDADINARNTVDKTPLDYAIQYRNAPVITYLKGRRAESESRFYPSFSDGPHFVWSGNSGPFVFYMYRDSLHDSVGYLTEVIGQQKEKFVWKGNYAGDTLSYNIRRNARPSPVMNEGVSRIFVLGDTHGKYEPVEKLLIDQGVMDENLNWNWGEGHLVFMGDVFDRGDKVTRILWLIYRLESQAAEAGGRVHFILGNHELMIMEDDQRDIALKYFYLCSTLGLNYSALYSLDTELGQWLRTKPVMLRINDILFVHAGLSPALLNTTLDMESINGMMFRYLHGVSDSSRLEDLDLILGDSGPLWYRGYFQEDTGIRADHLFLSASLEKFGVSRFVVGHNNVKEITSLFDGKVIATDVPFYNSPAEIQGLLIEKQRFYRALPGGKLEELDLQNSKQENNSE